MQTNPAIAEALAVIQSMKSAQPGLHTDVLADGFSALWNEKEELRLDKLISRRIIEKLEKELLANIPISAPDPDYDPNDQFKAAARDRYERVHEAAQKLRTLVNPSIKMRSQDWEDMLVIDVKDPAGWDRADHDVFHTAWEEPITRQEFMRRVALSTVRIYDWSPLLES
jgi:hypothetical protein